jgi:putative tryptophan/tyrosine transport system substrate-binding protein
LPAIYQWPEIAEAGGLAAYGPNYKQLYRQHAGQLAKLLRGTKPAEMPVEQPNRFALVINLKTAEALGLAVPQALLARADEVIE